MLLRFSDIVMQVAELTINNYRDIQARWELGTGLVGCTFSQSPFWVSKVQEIVQFSDSVNINITIFFLHILKITKLCQKIYDLSI